jgi:hypothetical protein
MKANEQTYSQIERTLKKVSEKFPPCNEPTILTDIHVRVTQESGEMVIFNDDDEEITRCVIEEWIDNNDENFYEEITPIIRRSISNTRNIIDNLGILKPYSFVLENDDNESITELYVIDDDTVIIDKDLMEGLDEDLNKFLKSLLN